MPAEVASAGWSMKGAFQQVVNEGDWGAAGNVIKIAGSGASQSFDHAVKEFQERFIAGLGQATRSSARRSRSPRSSASSTRPGWTA